MIVQDITGPAGFTAVVSVLMVVVGLVYLTGALFCRRRENKADSSADLFSRVKENIRNNKKAIFLY